MLGFLDLKQVFDFHDLYDLHDFRDDRKNQIQRYRKGL